ncbi:ATP-binding protein [Novosphingobium sp. SL115]|uniref:ATP-binding response regulator n=1 Tax=Novosphingobium sp. SL115 TaxID=2995150 RepID=UPI0022735C56|nr:ATP-binding protein [Novosphingobium sp. SL115]MCY1672004.1 ATP-binding protein [Novosphingobium sp. SL115]
MVTADDLRALHVLPITALGCAIALGGFGLVSPRAAGDQAPAERDDMIRDRDAATAASAAKSRYLASASHEIRSPLNAIYGYAQLVERGGAVDPKDAARVIRRSAEHLTNLVEGLLDIASVEQGMIRLDPAVVRLGPLVDQVADMFRPMAEAKGLIFRCEMPERLPEFVRMDERRVRQALINLVSNAVKFTASGEIVVALRWAGQMATFEVRDTGPGISESRQEQIFAPYERLDEVERTEQASAGQQGAGLGLAITRAIVHMLGGDLQLDSAVGVGSCFRIVLMLPQVSGMVNRAAERLRPIGYAGRRRSILLVDDDADHRMLLRIALGDLGFEVAQASDGHTALATSGKGHFDAVILDVQMPGISGWETAAYLRAVHGDALKIVMLSANANERHGLVGCESDHDRFLLKPVDLTAVIDALGVLLGLEWIMPESAVAQQDVPQTFAVPLSPQVREHAERLKSLVQIGHVRALEGEIRSLEQADPAASALVARLYDCLDRFDLAALGRTLEEL